MRVKTALNAELVFDSKPGSDLTFKVYKDFSGTPADLTDKRTAEDFGLIDLAPVNGRNRVKLGGVQGVHLAWEIENNKPNNPFSVFDVALNIEAKEQ
jgi:hypothetical protein